MASMVSISREFSSEEEVEIESDQVENSADDGSDVSGDEGSDVSGDEGSDVSGDEGNDVSGDEGSDVDNRSDVSADVEDSDDDNTQPPKKKKKEKSSIKEDEAPAGLADVFAKILNKEAPKHGVPILAKAKTDHQLHIAKLQKLQKCQQGKSEDSLNKLLLSYQKQQEQIQKRKRWENMARVKPDVLDKERERRLQKAATKGVVLLFNTVRKQQKMVDDQIKEVGPSEYKRDKVLKSVSKVHFLDMLKESSPAVTSQASPTVSKLQIKREKAVAKKGDEEKPSWSILKDDFMMGGTMKDWDKQESEDDEVAHSKNDDFNSSDSDT